MIGVIVETHVVVVVVGLDLGKVITDRRLNRRRLGFFLTDCDSAENWLDGLYIMSSR